MKSLISLVITLGATSAAAQTAPGVPDDVVGLSLTCQGNAAWVQTVTDDNGTISKFSDDTTTRHQRSAGGLVQLRFEASGVTYKASATLPGGGGDWRKLNGVLFEGENILIRSRGIFGTSTPLKIDRRSGEITMAIGGGVFSGLCQKGEPLPEARKF